jgi:hypothetical protein
MEYCCEDMMYAVEGGQFPGEPSVICYSAPKRLFGLIIGGNPQNQWILIYCPFCGKKLPEELLLEYDTATRDRESGKVLDPLPEEFKTDEWWRKRGL